SPRRLHRRLIWKPLVASLSAVGMLPDDSLNLANVQFASGYLKQEALAAKRAVSNAEVIHWGVDVDRFRFKDGTGNSKRLLFVGQLTPLKGVETAVQALSLIVQQRCYRSTTLTIVGGPDYGNRVRRL